MIIVCLVCFGVKKCSEEAKLKRVLGEYVLISGRGMGVFNGVYISCRWWVG